MRFDRDRGLDRLHTRYIESQMTLWAARMCDEKWITIFKIQAHVKAVSELVSAQECTDQWTREAHTQGDSKEDSTM